MNRSAKRPLEDPCCPYGGIVNILCFWGAMREATWKRTLLVVCAIALVGMFLPLFWIHRHDNGMVGTWILGGFLVTLGLLGIMVAINGCDACVARLCGNI
jgi:hypothetical protein